MANDKFEQALTALDPEKRMLLKRIVAGAAFAVPTVASFAVKDLAYGQVGSCSTTTVSAFVTLTTFTTGTQIVTSQVVIVTTTTVITTPTVTSTI